jgi:hypothetical protein
MLNAQKAGREVFTAMNALLPRELCDHVLSYLIPRRTTQRIQDVFPGGIRDHCCSDVPAGPSAPPASMLSGSSINHHQIKYIHPNDRIYLVDFISIEAATRAAERYYQINTFSVFVRNETESLRDLLRCDRFRLGLQPSGLIRKLEIKVFAEANSWHNIKRQLGPTPSLQSRLVARRRELTQIFARIPPEAIRKMEITFEIGLFGKFSDEDVLHMECNLLNTLFYQKSGVRTETACDEGCHQNSCQKSHQVLSAPRGVD